MVRSISKKSHKKSHKKSVHKRSKKSVHNKCICGTIVTKLADGHRYCKRCDSVVRFGAPPVRRPGLYGSHKKGHKKGRKGYRFGNASGEYGPGYPGSDYPGTTADYFGNNLMFINASKWWYPAIDKNGVSVGASPQMLKSA